MVIKPMNLRIEGHCAITQQHCRPRPRIRSSMATGKSLTKGIKLIISGGGTKKTVSVKPQLTPSWNLLFTICIMFNMSCFPSHLQSVQLFKPSPPPCSSSTIVHLLRRQRLNSLARLPDLLPHHDILAAERMRVRSRVRRLWISRNVRLYHCLTIVCSHHKRIVGVRSFASSLTGEQVPKSGFAVSPRLLIHGLICWLSGRIGRDQRRGSHRIGGGCCDRPGVLPLAKVHSRLTPHRRERASRISPRIIARFEAGNNATHADTQQQLAVSLDSVGAETEESEDENTAREPDPAIEEGAAVTRNHDHGIPRVLCRVMHIVPGEGYSVHAWAYNEIDLGGDQAKNADC